MPQTKGQAVKMKEYVEIELRETSSSMDRSCCLKEAVRPSPNLTHEPTRLSYLPVSVSHSWDSPLYSRDCVCSLFVVALNLQQKSTGVFQQLLAPAPSSTQCPLPLDSLMVVGEVSPTLGTPSLPRSLQILLCLGALPPRNRLLGEVLLSFISVLSPLSFFHFHVVECLSPSPRCPPSFLSQPHRWCLASSIFLLAPEPSSVPSRRAQLHWEAAAQIVGTEVL